MTETHIFFRFRNRLPVLRELAVRPILPILHILGPPFCDAKVPKAPIASDTEVWGCGTYLGVGLSPISFTGMSAALSFFFSPFPELPGWWRLAEGAGTANDVFAASAGAGVS